MSLLLLQKVVKQVLDVYGAPVGGSTPAEVTAAIDGLFGANPSFDTWSAGGSLVGPSRATPGLGHLVLEGVPRREPASWTTAASTSIHSKSSSSASDRAECSSQPGTTTRKGTPPTGYRPGARHRPRRTPNRLELVSSPGDR